MPSKKQKAQLKKKQVANKKINNARRSPLTRGGFGGRFGSSSEGYELLGAYHSADRKRNIWDQAGYPELVLPEMLWSMYRRKGVVYGIVNLIADGTWKNDPVIYEGEVDQKRRKESPTEFEQAIDKWSKKWKLWQRVKGADKRQMIMRYSGLIMHAKEPEKAGTEDPMQKVLGPEAIFKMMPVFETQIEVNESIQDPSSELYGQPKHFHFRSEVAGSRNTWIERDFILHPSRVITFAEGADDGSIYGIPMFESCFNSLLNLEKIETSGGEGFYKNASQKSVITLDPNLTQNLSPDQMDEFDENVDRWNRDMDPALILGGGSLEKPQSNMSDPKEYAMLSYNEVAASVGRPMAVIFGNKTGRLASEEDKQQNDVADQARQAGFGTDCVMDVLDWLIEYNALPKPKGELNVFWPDITEPSLSDKVELVEKMMLTNERSVKAQLDPVFSVEYMQEIMGMEPEEVEREPPEGDLLNDQPDITS